LYVYPSANIDLKGVGKVREKNKETLHDVAVALAYRAAAETHKKTPPSAVTSPKEDHLGSKKDAQSRAADGVKSKSTGDGDQETPPASSSGDKKNKNRDPVERADSILTRIEKSFDEDDGNKDKATPSKRAEKSLLESLQRAKNKGSTDKSEMVASRGEGRRKEAIAPPPVEEEVDDDDLPVNKLFARKATQLFKQAVSVFGPSRAFVENKSNKLICIITFNKVHKYTDSLVP
jgi:hypothetical protein